MTFLLSQWKFLVMAALVAVIGVQQMRINHAHKEYAFLQAQIAEERAKAAEAARLAEQEAREEEQRREQRRQEIIDEAEGRTEMAKAAASDAERAAASLRERLAAFTAAVRSATKDSKPAKRGEGQQGADALDVLADLFSRADDRAGELAVYADRLRIAGQACEQAFDGLRK